MIVHECLVSVGGDIVNGVTQMEFDIAEELTGVLGVDEVFSKGVDAAGELLLETGRELVDAGGAIGGWGGGRVGHGKCSEK